MATTAWLYPTAAAEDSSGGGYGFWNSLDRIYADDDSAASGAPMEPASKPVKDNFISLAPGGFYGGQNKASNSTLQMIEAYKPPIERAPMTVRSYGANNDTWGLAIGRSQLDTTFTVGVGFDSGDPIIKASGFDFSSIPSLAFVTGVEVEVKSDKLYPGSSYSVVGVDYIRMRVTYSTNFILNGFGTSSAFMYATTDFEVQEQPKSYVMKIYKNGQYLGQFKDIENLPSFKNQFNAVPGELNITLARNADGKIPVVDFITTELTNENISTEDEADLLALVDSMYAIGAGTDVDLNLDIELIAYYGGLEELTLENDELLLTEQDEPLMEAYGALDGKTIYSGYVSKWAVGYGGQEAVQVTVMSYGNDANHYIYKSGEVNIINNAIATDGDYGTELAGGLGKRAYETLGLAQTFTMTGTKKVGRLALRIQPNTAQQFSVEIRTGATIGGGTLLATAVAEVAPYDMQTVSFALGEPLELTAGTYHFVLTTSAMRYYNSAPYPAYVAVNSVYAGGAAYRLKTNNSGVPQPWATITGDDLVFALYEASNQTTVVHNSVEPADIFKAAIDYLAKEGVKLTYTPSSIKDTGTVVSYTFNNNTVLEVFNQVLKLCPADWYWHMEPGTNVVHLEPRPETPSQTFTLGGNIELMNIERSMEQVINDVWFSGGTPEGAPDGDPALFVHRFNEYSSNLWRRRLLKTSDQRVTVEATANLIADSELERNANPEYTIEVTVVAAKYPIEDIMVGQLGMFANFGNFIDEQQLQIAAVDYLGDKVKVTMGQLPPSMPKRIQDIKRNLDILEQQNNPISPV